MNFPADLKYTKDHEWIRARTSVRPETTIRGLPKPAMNGGKTRAMTRNVKSGKNIMTADYDLQSS